MTSKGATIDVGGWLQGLGLGQYEATFRENAINERVLPSLTAEDLKDMDIGIVGHRRMLLDAIALLRADWSAKAPPAEAPSTTPEASSTPLKLAQDTAERRQVTVMFSDLVGSTALSARMDPEDLREVISAYQKCVAESVQRLGGFVAKYMGDGVLVYFGYPQAHEDDAERAVRAGLDLIQVVGGLKSHVPLQTRVGIATGLVVVGDLIGAGEAQERGIVGDTPNLAARLQGIADPNTVVIADSTRKLLGNLFELADLPSKDLKGIDGPVRAFAALRPSAVESRFEALRTATTPLVGRDEELALLMRRWEQAKAGDGCVVLISGEPGIGKSRIAQAAVERVSVEPHTRLRYFCSPHHQDSALYPSIAQLERAAGFSREDTDTQRLEKLEAVLAQGTNDLSRAAPLLADLLSIPTDRYQPLNLTPQKRNEKTLHAQLVQVEGLAARQPVLMVFEDIHWSDPTTRELLDLLIDLVPTLRVLVILTFRPEFSPSWIGRSYVTMLTLNRLPRQHGREMIAYVTGGRALPKEISDQIIERTDGVPLFIEELTKTVVESSIMTEAGDFYAVAGPRGPLAIPTSLHASLLARLDRLNPASEVAPIGAALGRSFSYELISAVAGMPQQKLDGALEQLVGAGLMFLRGVPPDAEYTFKHALVQDAAYSTLLRKRRQQIHTRIAATLESQFPQTAVAQPEIIARHFGEAGLPEKAVGYWLKVGRQSMARSAMSEAEMQILTGLDLLSLLPENSERDNRELELHMALAATLSTTAGYAAPAVGKAYARARQLCKELDRPLELAFILSGQCVYHMLAGDLILACKEGQEILALGETGNNTDLKFVGVWISALPLFHMGDFTATKTHAELALNLYRRENPLFSWMPSDPKASGLHFLFRSLAYLGYLDQARSHQDKALAYARERMHPYSFAEALQLSAEIEKALEIDPTVRLKRAEELMAYCAEHGFPYWAAGALRSRGESLLDLGRTDEALIVLSDALNKIQATGAVTAVPSFRTSVARALGRSGRPRDGLKQLAEVERQIEATQERWYEAEMHRVYGELHVAAGDPTSAEDRFDRAIAVARRQNAKLWEIRAATSFSRLWRDQGKCTEARNLLAPVYHWFTEGLDTPVLQEAKALLDELSS
jgi:class 3 adenylate cyclase/predicted ATPase